MRRLGQVKLARAILYSTRAKSLTEFKQELVLRSAGVKRNPTISLQVPKPILDGHSTYFSFITVFVRADPEDLITSWMQTRHKTRSPPSIQVKVNPA